MATRRSFFLIAIILLLLGTPALARPGNGERRTKEEWEKQRAAERKERQKKLRDAFKGKSPQEREEILRKLKELEQKAKRDRLREKQKQYEMFKGRLRSHLSAPARQRLDHLGKDLQQKFVLHFMRRAWVAGGEHFMRTLTDEQRGKLAGLSGPEYWKVVRQITDPRVLAALSPEERKQLDALPDDEREKRFEKHRFDYIVAKMRKVEDDVVFPEAAALIQKPKAQVEQTLKKGFGPPGRRPHNRKGFQSPDGELQDLLDKLSKKDRKLADEEFRRIVAKHRDPAALKKALDEFKARLRKRLAD